MAGSQRLAPITLAALATLAAGSAQAGQASTPLQVRLRVLSTCSVVLAPADVASAEAWVIRCSRRTPFVLRLALGSQTHAATGAGMRVAAALWPVANVQAARDASPSTEGAAPVALHIDY